MATYYVNSSTGSDSNTTTQAQSPSTPWATIAHASGLVAAGDTVYIEAIAGNSASWPTSGLDYTQTSYTTPGAGSASVGWVKWIGRGGVPTIGSDGILHYLGSYQWYEGLYIVATNNAFGDNGLINGSGPIEVRDCLVNTNAKAGQAGVRAEAGGAIVGCTLYGGTTSPTASSNADLARCGPYNVLVVGNRIKYARGRGIVASAGTKVVGNWVYGCAGNSVETPSTDAVVSGLITGNTIDAGQGHGIAVTGTAGIAAVEILNNIVSNHAGSGKYGIEVSDGTTAQNDARKRFCNYNNLYNNSTAYHNISAGANDLAVDPQYADAANGDFTQGNAALEAGFP